MNIEYRPIVESELKEFTVAEDNAYSNAPSPEDRAAFERLFDYPRSAAAFADGKIVGGACYYKLGLSVPGSELDAAGVTYVFTVPTHRRRGVLTNLMRRQFETMRAEGISVATLHAAESGIYGRFGYGPAANTEVLEIETLHASFKRQIEPSGQFRLVNDEEPAEIFPDVYDMYRSQTPGLLSRDENWWKLRLRSGGHVDGSPGWMKLVYEREGKAVAYAIYRVEMNWQNAVPESTLHVIETATTDSESYAATWQYLLSVDLVKSVRAFSGPNPPIWWLLADPRRLTRQTRDGLWVRLVDVPSALAGRKYLADGTVTMRVKDEFCPWNDGTFRIESSGGHSTCEQTDVAPDLTIGVSDLAATYLGGTSFHTLAAASLVEEHAPGSLSRANEMFSWHTAPMTSAPEPLT